MNQGQLVTLLRSEYLVPAKGLSKVTGRPFTIAELDAAIDAALEAAPMNAPASARCASPRTTPPTRRSAGAPAAATTRSSRPC